MATRKGNGEGTIFQRKTDGMWVGRASLGFDTINHKRMQKSVYGKTKEEVRKKLIAIISDKDKGLTIHTSSQKLSVFLNTWLESVVKNKVRATTYRSYEQICRNHLIPGLGHLPLEKVTPQIIQRFLIEKSKTGISTEHLRRVLRAALNHAMKWEMVVRNAATLVSVPKKEKFKYSHFDIEQTKKFIEGAKQTRHSALFTVTVAMGLRLGEALGLKWDDVDLENGTLTVKHQLQRINGKLQLVDPKTARARRTLSMPEFVVAELRAHKVKQLELRLLQADVWQDNGFVFSSSIGTAADPRNVRKVLEQILKDNELPKVRFHDLRHTCATILLSQGTDLRVMMEILGHSQISITMDTYAHVLPQVQKEAAAKMDAALRAAN